MWDNDLRSLWNFPLTRKVKWNKSPHARRLFTWRSHISRPKGISQIPQGIYFTEKNTFCPKDKRCFFLAPPVGLEPTTPWLTVRCSTDWAKEECLCWHYLFSRPVTRQVSSAHVSLTSVFGMGTGGPSQQSTPTCLEGLPLHLCQSSLGALTALILAQFPAPVKQKLHCAATSLPEGQLLLRSNLHSKFSVRKIWWPVPDSNRC